MEEEKETQDTNTNANTDNSTETRDNIEDHKVTDTNADIEPTTAENAGTDIESREKKETGTETEPQEEEETGIEAEPREEEEISTEIELQEEEETGIEAEPREEEEISAEIEPQEEEEISTETEPREEEEISAQTEPREEEEISAEAEPQEEEEISAQTEPQEEEETGTEAEPQEVDEFAELMKDYDLKAAKAQSRITGKIIDIIDKKVIIDIGQKTEGILNKEELYDWDGSLTHDVGDSITVICKNINMRQGYITVSKKQVDEEEGWQKVKRAYEKRKSMPGKIIGMAEEGKGFKVDMGIEMFLPISQADVKKIKSPKSLLGKEYQFKITRINSREKNGVVSRRVILEEERQHKIKELFDSLQTGDLVKGVVTSLTDYGAFVNIGGMDGLIHKDNISYGRVNHPKEKLRKGDEVEAMVLEMDPEHNRISLGLKQKYPDPWVDIEAKYPVGKKLIAKVTKIVSFGAFIELEEGVEGLLHISDLTWEGKTNSVEEFVAVGERLWVQVIELNPEEKKIKLGLKQLEMRPEEKYIQKYKTGDIVKGLVKKILKSRVFVELEKGVEGVIKISDISYFRIDSPHEFLREKETIDVMILNDSLDSNYKVKLGIKQLADDEWRKYINENKHGAIVPIKIKKITENGISVEISRNIEGFIRPNEIDDKKLELEAVNKLYHPGDKVEAMVLNSDFERKRMYLSLRAVKRKREREEIDKYSKAENESITTIGDLFESAIDKKK